MSRHVRQTWNAGMKRREKGNPDGGNCCAKPERLESMCLIPENKKSIMAGEKS